MTASGPRTWAASPLAPTPTTVVAAAPTPAVFRKLRRENAGVALSSPGGRVSWPLLHLEKGPGPRPPAGCLSDVAAFCFPWPPPSSPRSSPVDPRPMRALDVNRCHGRIHSLPRERHNLRHGAAAARQRPRRPDAGSLPHPRVPRLGGHGPRVRWPRTRGSTGGWPSRCCPPRWRPTPRSSRGSSARRRRSPRSATPGS